MGRYRFDLVVMALCSALLFYVGWHGFYGPRSFTHREALETRAAELDAKLAQISRERAALEKRVGLLRPESVDPDMLDELARQTLDYVRPADLLVRLPDDARPP